ncbi:VOC family protein [Corynebacterium callunae]|uniref:VOC family protein n=1 Tax=Corynebacterium callunae TaxID=1721 RepID=UPI003982885C
MGIKRLDNIAIVVESLDEAISFFELLGMKLHGRAFIEGDFADIAVELEGIKSEIAVLETPDGHSRIELSQYLNPPPIAQQPPAQNALGVHRLMFNVDDIDQTLADLGAEPINGIAQYQETYRLSYLRGPSGIILALAQDI